jgi:hypothetical protein
VSQILSEAGHGVIKSLTDALKAGRKDVAVRAAALAANLFEPAIALDKDQIAGYTGMAHLCAVADKRREMPHWARRGLAELERMRRYQSAMRQSKILPPDILEQIEKYLRSYLTY